MSTSIKEKKAEAHDEDYPDGGSLAWRQVLAGHLIQMMAGGYATAFGVYQLYYTDSLQLPSSQISWIGSVQIFLNCIGCLISGRLADTGYVREVVLCGSLLVLLGSVTTSFAQVYWQIFLAQGVCTGFGLGLMYSPSITVISSYFKKKRTLAITIASTGSGTGSIIFPATVQYLMPLIGFRWAVSCAGLVVLMLAILMNLLLKPRSRPSMRTEKKCRGRLMDSNALKEAPFLLFTAGAFLLYWALYFGYFYINTYAISTISFTPTSAVSLILITNAAGIPIRPLIGYLADAYLGPLNTFMLSCLSLALSLFFWTLVHTKTTMYVWAVFFGACNAAAMGGFLGALASPGLNGGRNSGGDRVTGNRGEESIGERFGLCSGIIAIATVAGPPTAGAIIDACGSFVWAQVWAGAVVLGAVAMLAMSKNLPTSSPLVLVHEATSTVDWGVGVTGEICFITPAAYLGSPSLRSLRSSS
ncbi:major facilitator superfamily transporter [Xylariaceae sp. FL0016]|nr:major facilitator superfamily transporter [Xylariaceae sp. FL0016]